MLENWKRTQATNVMMWGMKGYEHNEPTRPQYNAVAAEVPSPVSGLPARFYSNFYYRTKITVSTVGGVLFAWVVHRPVLTPGVQIVVMVLIGIVVVCVGSIFILRAVLVRAQQEGNIPAGTAGYLAAFINAVQIHILNFIYAKVARKLNNWGA